MWSEEGRKEKKKIENEEMSEESELGICFFFLERKARKKEHEERVFLKKISSSPIPRKKNLSITELAGGTYEKQ